MSAAVERALAEALSALALNGVYRGAPVQATAPYATVAESVAEEWGTKDRKGRQLRLAVTLWDSPERIDRLLALMGEAERAVEALPRRIDGWEVASLVFQRSRVVRAKAGPWAGTSEWRMRMLREG